MQKSLSINHSPAVIYGCIIGILIALIPQPATAHPNHKNEPFFHAHPAYGEELLENLPDMKLDNETARYYFELFTQLIFACPTRSQDEMIHVSEMLFLQFDEQKASLNPLPPPYEPRQVAYKTAQLYQTLTEEYPVIQLRLIKNGFAPGVQPEPLPLTESLLQYVLVEILNTTTAPQTINASFEGLPGNQQPLVIPPGQIRTLALPIMVNASNNTKEAWPLTLTTEDSTAITGTISVPVSIVAPAVIKGTLIDSDSGEIFPGRVYASGGDHILRHGKAYAYNQTVSQKPMLQFIAHNKSYKLPFFYSDGSFEVAVAPGEVDLTLERGFEHEIVTENLILEPGETREVTLSSGRMIDMKSEGWISGDTHIHWAKNHWSENEDINLLAVVQRAEDLRVANNLTLLQASGPATFTKPDQFPMGPVPGLCDDEYHIQMAEEYRNDNFYGHLCFLNIKRLIQPISTGPGSGGGPDALDYPTNRAAIEECRRQGGISIEAHNLGPFNRSDVPVNVIQGLSDSLDQLDPKHYYNFLNCGFRIPLTNGSDHPARVAGITRAYVKVDGDFTYEKWIEGIRQCRTFTTSGPLLFLEVNGKEIGDVLDVARDTPLTIKARAISRHPIGKFQLVSNDEILAEKEVKGNYAELRVNLNAEQSRWFVARASATYSFDTLAGTDIGHTSAIYVDVDGRPVFKPESAKTWISLIKAHADNVKANANFDNDSHRQEALDHIHNGLELYEQLLVTFGENTPPAQ